MNRFLRPALILLLALTAAGAVPTRARAQTLSDLSESIRSLSERVTPAVVQVLVTGYSPFTESAREVPFGAVTRTNSTGSGVILDSEGYIVTNAHVVQGAQRVEVLIHEAEADTPPEAPPLIRSRRVPARVVGLDFQTDIAVLKVEETGLPTLPLADWTAVRQGQLVFAFGAPRGLDNTMTMGVVSTPVRQFTPDYPMVYIQTDAPINPGNSGGPLVNAEGEVVGLNTLIFSESGGSEGLGFATPSLVVETVYGEIREKGWFTRGDIGVLAQTVTPTLSHALGLSQSWGVILSDVLPNGPGDAAGLQPGDVVITLDGQPVDNSLALTWRISRMPVGTGAQLEVYRDGLRVPVTVRVTERPGDEFSENHDFSPEENLLLRIGAMVVDVQRDVPELRGRTRRPYGALVAVAARPGSPVSVGLERGDVIYEVNGREVETLSVLRSVIENLRPGDPVVLHVERQGVLRYLTFEIK